MRNDLTEPTVRMSPTATLRPYANNPRTHAKAQVRQIAESIKAFGFTNPIIVDTEDLVLAGHGRLEAAKLLGLEEVPTLCIGSLTEAQKKAYIIADNRLAEKSTWNDDLLAIELQSLMALEADFDITVTGFQMPEIDLKVQELDETDLEEDDELPPVPVTPVTRRGDLWRLGDHLLLCGDALDPASYTRLLDGAKADLVLTDPPYNVAIDGHVSGLGKVKHEEFAMASGEMSEEEFTAFLIRVTRLMAEHSIDGSIHFVFMDWRHMGELLAAGKAAYTELKNLCVWNKDNGGMGALYRSKHELVAVFKNGKAPHINNVSLGKHGRYRTNVWNYRGVNTLRQGREDELAMHPTVKPVRMLADAIMDCSNRGQLVLDPFGGSGSTLIAAGRTGRRARLIELEPKYVDVAITRWEKATGGAAVNVATGNTFAKQAAEVLHG